MSEHTLCNYCTLQQIKRRARKEGKKVTIINDLGGATVLVDDAFAVWFMELTTKCAC